MNMNVKIYHRGENYYYYYCLFTMCVYISILSSQSNDVVSCYDFCVANESKVRIILRNIIHKAVIGVEKGSQ